MSLYYYVQIRTRALVGDADPYLFVSDTGNKYYLVGDPSAFYATPHSVRVYYSPDSREPIDPTNPLHEYYSFYEWEIIQIIATGVQPDGIPFFERSEDVVALLQGPALLFSTGDDYVDFNQLSEGQKQTLADGADPLHGFGGDDRVTLPNIANYNLDVGGGNHLGWVPLVSAFVAGDTLGQHYQIVGGDGADKITLGDGIDTVYGSPGDDSITSGRGQVIIDYRLADYPAWSSNRTSGDFRSFVDGTKQTIIGGHSSFEKDHAIQNLIWLPGSAFDYEIRVHFSANTLAGTTTTITTSATGGFGTGVALQAIDVEGLQFATPIGSDSVAITNNIVLAVEALQLAAESYGDGYSTLSLKDIVGLGVEPLAYSGGKALEASRAVPRGWHPVSAMELGIAPADLDQYGSLKYSFVNGVYQAIEGVGEADALVLLGTLNGKRTLAISFRGTDQIDDFADFIDFGTHYRKFAPLVDGIRWYLSAGSGANVEKVLVSGHSLGSAMTDYLLKELPDGSYTVQAYTDGTTGMEFSTNDPRILNFIHTWDPIPGLTGISATSIYGYAYIAVLFATLGLTALPQPKQPDGVTIKIHDDEVTWWSLTAHEAWRYTNNVDKIYSFAMNSPLVNASTEFGVLAQALKDNTRYDGPSLTIAVGHHGSSKITFGPDDKYVLGYYAGYSPDESYSSIVWDTPSAEETVHYVDGGLGRKTVVELPGSIVRYDWDIKIDGSVDLSFRFDATTLRQIGKLYNVSMLIFNQKEFVPVPPRSAETGVASASTEPQLVVKLDGSAVSVQMPSAGQAILTVDRSFDYADTGDGDISVVGTNMGDVIAVGNGSVTITEGNGNDIIFAKSPLSAGNLTVFGGTGGATITAGSGNDVFHVGIGANRIDGGGGSNVVTISASSGDFSILRNADHSFSVTDNTGLFGSDVLLNVQSVQFTDRTVALATAPVVIITSPGGAVSSPAVTIAGTVDLFDIASTVTILEGSTVLGTAIVQVDGSWSAVVTLTGDGAHLLVAEDVDVAGDIGQSNAVGYFLDGPTVSIAAAAAVKAEGNSGTTAFTFTVTLTGDTSVAHSVSWAVTGSGANPANGADFGGPLPSGTVSFAVGETSKTVTVDVSGDATVEADEGFTVTLSNPSANMVLGTATASGTIQNDDVQVSTVSIVAAAAVKAEGSSGATAFTFTVTLAGDTSVGHSVSWGVTGSGADQANGSDFAGGVLPSGMATFIAGETSKTVTVLVAGDAVVEPDEGFTVTLTAPSSGLSIGTGSAVAAIVNDELSSARTTAHDDAYIVLQGTGLDEFSISGVLANDDVVGSATASASTVQLHGGTSFRGPLHIFLGGISPSGAFNYYTNGFVGVESFTYTVTSANGTTDQAKVSLYVVPVNAGPSTTLNLLALSAEEQIAATYAAFFGRAADAPGLAFWVGEFNRSLPTQGATALFANIASSFGVSAEAKTLYPFLANPFGASDAQITAFLDSVYNNLFNRSSDAGGLGYWTGQVRQTLASGQFVGSVLVNIMSGAQDTESGRDITTLMGKVAVSLGFVHRQQELGTGLVGTIDVDNATLLLSSVTDDPTSVLRGLKEAATLAAVESLEGELDYGPNGLNTLVLPDRLDRYRLTSNGPSENGSNLSITNDDVDVTLSGISRVRFSDAYQAFDIDGHAGQLYRLYGAALGRVPDAAGFGWNLHLADAGTRLHDLAQFMMSTPEFGAAYGNNLTDDQFIVQLYQHTLGRLPDTATISDWQHRLISGTVDRADALLALSESEDHRREADKAINNGIGVDYSYFLGGQNFAGGGARDIHLSTGPDTVQFGLGEGDIVSTKLPVAGFEPFAEFAGAGYWGVPLSGQSARITASTSSTMTRLVGFEAGTGINHDALEFKVSSWHSINSGNVLTGGNGYSEIHAPVAPTTPAVAVGTIFHLATPNAVLPAPQEKPYLVVFDSIAKYADAAGLAEALESTAGAITFYGSGFRVPSAHLLFAYKSTTGNVRVADVDFIPPRVGPTELNSAAANFVVLASDMAELVGVTSLAMLAGENFKFVG